MKPQVLAVAIVIAGCTSVSQPPAPAAQASQFKNLQVLPADIERDELIATMRGFTRSLGVRCNHCHVVTATEPKEQLDFPSDAKEEKRVARVMVRMVREINGQWLPLAEAAEHEMMEPQTPGVADTRVQCWTCHRGKPEPEPMPPPPAEAQKPS